MPTNKMDNSPYALEFLAEFGGAKSIDVVKTLSKHKEIDEFKLADKLKVEVKAIRRILYRLYEKKLVSFRKMRDMEKGWYIYIWRLEPNKLSELVNIRKNDAVERMKKQLDQEKSTQFFKCENGCMRITFDKAFEFGFICPDCGNKFNHFDNSAIVKQLKQYIDQVDTVYGG